MPFAQLYVGSPELEALSHALRRGGVMAALELVNHRVLHRFSAIYQLKVGVMKNIAIYDKTGQTVVGSLMEVPLANSFCQFVLRDETPFLTSNSQDDDRLAGHPAQGIMMAYHAVPLLGNRGELFGTLCHFDMSEQPFEEEEFRFLQRAARLFAPYMPSEND